MKKTTEGLRDILFAELERYLTGEVDSEHVRTVTKATGAILATVAKDIEAAKLLHEMNEGRDQPRSIADLNLNLLLSRADL
jgi:hypothetical protein